MAKKTNRIMVALVCTETGIQNYVTSVSKLNPDILKKKVKKYHFLNLDIILNCLYQYQREFSEFLKMKIKFKPFF